jgi:SAM-dependent methyltransferase
MLRKKYSKSSAFYAGIKADFFSENDTLLKKAIRENQSYSRQPRRASCKLCTHQLNEVADFKSHGISYGFCVNCGHLNGLFEDTKEFVKDLYIENGGREYSKNYIDNDFRSRTQNIYVPKLNFLIESLPQHEPLKILDVGCGSGYFVFACLSQGVSANGIDVSKVMIEFGNAQISHLTGRSPLEHIPEDGFFDAIIQSDATVLSAIGVIEHLRNPQRFLTAFRKSDIKYLFYSVPMFSLSALIENVFTLIFPRQLSGGHTHLFTESSIAWLHKSENIFPIAEWRFGTDVMDLYRSIFVGLRSNGSSKTVLEQLENGLAANIDEIQAIFDKSHFCSEIHCLTKKEYS